MTQIGIRVKISGAQVSRHNSDGMAANQLGWGVVMGIGLSAMDIFKVLGDLQQERDQIDETILSLERLALSNGKRRGRPPA